MTITRARRKHDPRNGQDWELKEPAFDAHIIMKPDFVSFSLVGG
ncbi:predicted protein [Sclerotinia sclerotiorum 1980 UF-70]|uniref:Uncharacterized protein n=1 Tax=Sclerotinia sclerotiorum (strain ATCC 18683 / 1980 / Ss-1) TaxID=665079 RepID=A7EGV1_SCLS1|nr:predicted protein [Sclerotinia sclerotiorum 1980 UF-70]EDO02067.1 predicted protein [Sclerotinia sclerotiorum 1980 UF-70]